MHMLALTVTLTVLLPPASVLVAPGFEKSGGGVAEDVSHTLLNVNQVPAGWLADQWRQPFVPFECAVDKAVFHSGAASVRLSSADLGAKIGLYSEQQLGSGRYRVSLWARCQPGGKALLRISLGKGWLSLREVGEQWTECLWTGIVDKPHELEIRAEARTTSAYWIDDVSLEPTPQVVFRYVRDTRPSPPKTLLFSPLTLADLTADAEKWAERGFGGFLLDRVMHDWSSNVWAADNDPATVGAADATFQALRACNEACAHYGIHNFIKVAFYSKLPLWTDEAAWAQAAENFRQCAIMARDTLCQGIALDTEYVAEQYDPRWDGYTYQGYTEEDLHRAARLRGRQIVQAMLSEFPEMEFLTLPEGIVYYGPFYEDLFRGMLDGVVDMNAPGGLHLMTESTYSMTDYEALLEVPQSLRVLVTWGQPERIARYWDEKCSVVLGAWPLGYYRDIRDKEGGFAGYGGREDIFGDEVIGSYADRGPRFPVEEFRQQMAGVSAACTRYNWMYSHGAVWWPTPGQLEVEGKPPREVEQARARRAVPNLHEYYAVVRDHYLLEASAP